jgi:tRNA threonylcarbamoyladenosine biosynthesis protein TsaB
MRTLALDTSTKFLSVALFDDNKVKAELHEDAGIRHSEMLVPVIDKLLKKIKWELAGLDLICVGIGPGSFTGLRIAVSTVKAFAAVAKTKVIGVPTMDAIVMNYKGSGIAAPLLDARKEKIYSCLYDMGGDSPVKLTDYLLQPVGELLSGLEREVTFFGDGALKYRSEIDGCALARYDGKVDWYPKAVDIGRIGINNITGGTVHPKDLEPLYLHAKECNITQKRSGRTDAV